ncbi:MAG: glycosyl hydrolase family 18 protein [Lachnospiraceae bacterium]|nr:glycosyl hydrolase family 18 protein [Lachnospiraceae bacterium]
MIYVVSAGDTVDRIAADFGIPVETLIYDNQIPYPYRLAIGQALFITDQEEREDKRSIFVNGYAYPFIREWVLRQTLPYLTELSVFSYGFTTEGILIPPIIEDQWMIDLARQYGVNPILTLTPLDDSGRFNNNLISVMVNDEEVRNTLIIQLINTLYEKNYAGTDIDFEYILAEDRDAFTEFVRVTTESLNAEGFQVSVALAPKTSAEQQGLLYEGKDYRALGEAANSVLLMTYEWGYTFGPPMAVAPLNKVREVVEYAITEIDPAKINLGIPNYGYDWTLPYVRGESRARTIGNVEAVQLAITQGVEIQFDPIAQTPFYTYVEQGLSHEVWFEDVRSLNEKFDLVYEYGLRGVGYWQIMQLFRANWLLLESRFRV